MVLVASGPHGSGNASGSISADTYSHNRFGQYVRNRTKPVNPNTARQQATRGALALLTARWSATVTAVQRTAWKQYADNVVMKNKIGEDTLLTGFNHYLRSNVMLARLGLTIIDAAPTVFELPAKDPTYACTASEATQQITVTFDNTLDWAVETGGIMYIFQGTPQNPQRNFFGGPWSYIRLINGIDPGGAVSPDVGGVLFAIAQGQRQWIYSRIGRADGRLSEPFQAQVLVGA